MITQQTLIDRQGGYIDVPPEHMPSTKINAFLEEFPWVKKYIKEPICQVYVSRIEPDLLDRLLCRIDVGMLFESQYLYEEAYLLDENKELVVLKEERKYFRKRYLFFGSKILCKRTIRIVGKVVADTSIRSVMRRLGEKAQSVHYILSYYSYTSGVIIYKSPKNIPIADWVRNKTASEKASFQKTLAEIDAEA